MGVALRVRLDKLDSLNSSTCSVNTSLRHKNKQLTKLTTEIVLSGSKFSATAKCKELGSIQNVEFRGKGHSRKQKTQIYKQQRGNLPTVL